MEDKHDEATAKKLLSFLKQEGKKKAVKDLQTALLNRVDRPHYQDVKVEFFECLEDVKQVKTGVLIYLNDGERELTAEEITNGKKIVADITVLLEEPLNPPEPKIDSASSKYTFKDGSQSRFEDYTVVENTYRDNVLFDKIVKLVSLSSDGFAFLGVQDKNLWERDDGVKLVNLAGDNDGREN